RKVNGPVVVGGLLVAVVLVLQAASVTATLKAPQTELPKLNLETAAARADVSQVVGIQADLKEGTLPDAKLMGLTLFDRYGFHLQVIALLLVVGTVGVVALSKKDKGPAA
ncbi:MAG: NADH-quinone oxidoreductase subunit J, partial [Verrucomicrobiales bacterium]|nr:NADH-quinone oxidoreductase subunit J [Verrucomicrobiales bacterium]